MKQQSKQQIVTCDPLPDPKSGIQCKTPDASPLRSMVPCWAPVYVEGMKNGERFCDIFYSSGSLTLEGERIHG